LEVDAVGYNCCSSFWNEPLYTHAAKLLATVGTTASPLCTVTVYVTRVTYW